MSENEESHEPAKVMIAGVYKLFCEALAERLNKVEGLEVTAVCEEDSELAYRLIAEAEPDVLLVDLHAGEQEMLNLTLRLTTAPDRKVMVIGVGNLDKSVAAASAGARGCASIRTGIAELVTMIRRVRRGEVVTPGDADLTDLAKRQWEGSRLPSWLTVQHLFILELVGKGLKSKQIAEELDLPASVVDKRVRELLREFGVRQRPAAVAVARERRWI